MTYLIGASGHGKVVLDILRLRNHEVLGFFDDNESLTEFRGLKSYGKISEAEGLNERFIIAIGLNNVRKNIDSIYSFRYTAAIHPQAICDSTVAIDEGTVVMAGAILNADVKIGRHVIVNTGAIIEHDCKIGNYAHLSPNCTLSGGVKIGEGVHVGAGAVVIPGISIGDWATVGAGTVVIRDVLPGETVVGNPARRIR